VIIEVIVENTNAATYREITLGLQTKIMKKVVLSVIMLMVSAMLMAQFPGMTGKRNAKAMNMGHVYGKVVDSLLHPLDAASVVILQNKYDSVSKKRKDILLKAMNTNGKGEFSFDELPMFGALKLEITSVGFKPYATTVAFKLNFAGMKPPSSSSQGMPDLTVIANAFDKDLGNIKLSQQSVQLANVTVINAAQGLKMDIDKKTFTVDKNIVSSGGTAVDVMKNVPSVQVDIDGNVKLRNGTPQIYIDGRPTTLSLDQIPADAIESVEVITNPSAKYDAGGGNAGILNLVLKKARKTGYNGYLMAGTDSKGGYNGGGSFSVRQGKINLSATTFMNGMRNKATGTTDRYTYANDPTHVFQTNTDKTTGAFIFGRLGLDYYVTNRTTLSVAAIKVHGVFKPTSDIVTDSLDNSNNVFKYNYRATSGRRNFNATGAQISAVHNYVKEGKKLTFDANLFGGKNGGNSFYSTNSYLGDNAFRGHSVQQQLSKGTIDFYTFQSDYVNPLTKKVKLEAGVRAQIHKTVSDNDILMGSTSDDLIKIPALTNNYSNTDYVYAAYTTITKSIKNFGYQFGLRAESSDYKGELSNTGQSFKNSYPISLFPSIFLSQKLKNDQELQLNYSRRINRPSFFQLIPWYDFSDSLNITKGNPNLVPEFTNSIEFAYSKNFKGGNNLLFSIYYKQTSGLITRYLDTESINGQKLLINSYINARSGNSYGAELTSVNNIKKWWDVTTNINLYNGKINTSNIASAQQQNSLVSWFAKVNTNFKLNHNLTFQFSGNYQSKTNLPITENQGQWGPPGMQAESSSQGYIKAFWNVDFAVRKAFLKNQAASVSLSISDIFRTRANEQISLSPGILYQDYYRLNNPQLVRLNFSYRFGKMDFSLFKRQNMKSTGTQDAMQMVGQ
jgi:ferric enterobactin receptor